jgi:4-hydroxybenzoate polyprenyltransferase
MLRSVYDFFRLIRTSNLLMMAATQFFAYYCLTDYSLLTDLLSLRFISLVLATVLTAASGYIINDYLDIKIDYINKPEKVIVGNTISRRTAMFWHLLLNVLAVAFGLIVSIKLALWIVLCAVVLWFYSVVFKKSFLTGNLLIAFLSAFVVLILLLFDKNMPKYTVWAYGLFAFAVTLIREITKDIEDYKGDMQYKSKTLPIVSGIRFAKSVVSSLCIALIACILIHLFIGGAFLSFEHKYAIMVYAGYMILFVCIPILIIFFMLTRSDRKSHFRQISTLLKVVMIAGIASMLWFRI